MMVFNQVKDSVTPEIEAKAQEKLSEWFEKMNNNCEINKIFS